MGFLRIGFFAFIILTAFYWALSWYFRSLCRGSLEREWDEEVREGDRAEWIAHPANGDTQISVLVREGDRAEWIAQGMADYDSSLRKKLVLAIYVIPVIVMIALVYLTNYA